MEAVKIIMGFMLVIMIPIWIHCTIKYIYKYKEAKKEKLISRYKRGVTHYSIYALLDTLIFISLFIDFDKYYEYYIVLFIIMLIIKFHVALDFNDANDKRIEERLK